MTAAHPVTHVRRWATITWATLLVLISFWSMAYGLAVSVAGTPADPQGDAVMVTAAGVSLAVALLPVGFAVAGAGTRRDDWPIAVLGAMGLALAVGLPLLWFGNPLASLMAGWTAGAAVTLARPEATSIAARAVAATAVVAATFVGMAAAFPLFAIIAPALPFTAPAVADRFARVGVT